MSLSNHAESQFAKALRGGGAGTNVTAPANLYVKLHVSDPTEACTAGAAGTTTRVEVTFGAESGGSITSSGTVSFTNVSTTETISHVSVWDSPTAGNAWAYGALAAPVALNAGDTLNLTSITLSLD